MKGLAKLAFLGILTAAALALSFLESLLPPLGVLPGAKLGLPNMVTVLALYLLPDARDAFLVMLARVLLGSTLVGAGTFSFSFAGAMVSFFTMRFLKERCHFPLIAVSVAGGISHNAAQLALAAWMLRSPGLTAYLPLYGAAGMLAGLAVGAAAAAALEPVRRALRSACR